MHLETFLALTDVARQGDVGGLDQLDHLFEVVVVAHHADQERALLLGFGRGLALAGEFGFELGDFLVELEIEVVDVARLPAAEGFGPGGARWAVRQRRLGRHHGHLDAAGFAVRAHFDHRHGVETQQGEVVQIVVGERFTAQVGMDQPQRAEPADTAAQAADVGQLELLGVADDDVADVAIAFHQHADLTAELAGDFAEVFAELGGGDLLGRSSPPEGSLERLDQGGLDAANVAVDVGNSLFLKW